MEIRKIYYPFDNNDGNLDENIWYKFGQSVGAVDIKDFEIEKWINNCVQSVKRQLENGVESPHAFCASGNAIVICFYSKDIDEDVFNDSNYFSVIVAKNYEQGDFFISDIKDDFPFESILKKMDKSDKDLTITYNGYKINIRKAED